MNITKRMALGIAAATIAAASGTIALTGTASADEDSGSWSCATQGNLVCGPGHGPNLTDHNVYYGPGPLPYIPGRLTTWPDGTTTGQANTDPVDSIRTANVSTDRIEEDEPGWDCRTMGNRVCGVAGTYGEIFLVRHDEQGKPVFVEHRDKTVWDYLPNN